MAEFIRPQTPEKPIRIRITLPSNAYFMSGVRDFTLTFIKNATSFNEQWAYRFQAIVDELCNNAIEYGSTLGSDITLTLTYTPNESLEVTVEDTGTGKNRITAAELQALVNEHRKPGYIPTEIRGRGLGKIVAEWTDELEFSDHIGGGIVVRAKKMLPEFAEATQKPVVRLGGTTPLILQ